MSYLKQKLSLPLVKYSVLGHRLVACGCSDWSISFMRPRR